MSGRLTVVLPCRAAVFGAVAHGPGHLEQACRHGGVQQSEVKFESRWKRRAGAQRAWGPSGFM